MLDIKIRLLIVKNLALLRSVEIEREGGCWGGRVWDGDGERVGDGECEGVGTFGPYVFPLRVLRGLAFWMAWSVILVFLTSWLILIRPLYMQWV